MLMRLIGRRGGMGWRGVCYASSSSSSLDFLDSWMGA